MSQIWKRTDRSESSAMVCVMNAAAGQPVHFSDPCRRPVPVPVAPRRRTRTPAIGSATRPARARCAPPMVLRARRSYVRASSNTDSGGGGTRRGRISTARDRRIASPVLRTSAGRAAVSRRPPAVPDRGPLRRSTHLCVPHSGAAVSATEPAGPASRSSSRPQAWPQCAGPRQRGRSRHARRRHQRADRQPWRCPRGRVGAATQSNAAAGVADRLRASLQDQRAATVGRERGCVVVPGSRPVGGRYSATGAPYHSRPRWLGGDGEKRGRSRGRCCCSCCMRRTGLVVENITNEALHEARLADTDISCGAAVRVGTTSRRVRGRKQRARGDAARTPDRAAPA